MKFEKKYAISKKNMKFRIRNMKFRKKNLTLCFSPIICAKEKMRRKK